MEISEERIKRIIKEEIEKTKHFVADRGSRLFANNACAKSAAK